MPVVRGISLTLNEKDVFRRQEIRESRIVRPSIKSIARELMKRKEEWLNPVLAYSIYSVLKATDGSLEVGEGKRIGGPAVASSLKKAREIAVIVCTIGRQLEDQIEEYFKAGDSLRGFLLDGLGSAAIDSLGNASCKLIESEAASHGYVTSSPLSPGMQGWEIQELPALLQLAPAEEIGVSITSGGMMSPRKSIAMVIGFGRDMPRRNHIEFCESCNLRDTCRHARRPGALPDSI